MHQYIMMPKHTIHRIVLLLPLLCLAISMQAYMSPHYQGIQKKKTESAGNEKDPKVTFRSDCDNAITQIDQAINNVRARLLSGGDVWWDGNNGRYVVPKVPPGEPEVSSLYAGAVWIGGVDPAGNLKLAAQTFGRNDGSFDFYPGPLDPETGKTSQDQCSKWDKFFVVKGASIQQHLRNFEEATREGKPYDPADIPKDVKGWPARGNEFFSEIHQFSLPNTSQGLAGFWDQDGDGNYDPTQGDFPVIEVRGCTDKPQFPDEMIFWVYNDAGNIHRESQGDAIQMEIQVQAFSYATNDEINDMTFQRYKLINRAIEDIDSTYFAMWVDPDLGCSTDDYVGCDTLRDMAFVYNQDALDGETGCVCPGAVNTYCDEIPVLGVDYFRGPLNEDGVEIGMSSFTYYNRGGTTPAPPAGTTDPANSQEYYNYISGSWRDGSPFTFGGDAFQDGAPVKYAFTEAPDNANGWSMCTAGAAPGDRRTLQASGPFRLLPGATNELIIGVVWVADQSYPCPSIRRLQEADDIAQALFDNCFEITDGPDAPDVDYIELDREIIAVFTNDTVTSNNAYEKYAQRGLQVPVGTADSLYTFEGYKLFQLASSDVTLADLDNPDKARLVYQVDLKNNVNRVFNWASVDNPTGREVYVPSLEVEGGNLGIRHTFRIVEDQFAKSDRRLINHKKYYFVALAYAHNNYLPFDPKQILGQRRPYLEGRRNIGDGTNPFYTVIPRPITDRLLNASYGDGVVITRIDGAGAGGNFLDMNTATRDAILGGTFDGKITYQPGAGPVEVQVFNPLEVRDGNFELTFVDENMANNTLDKQVFWQLSNLDDPSAPVIRSERSLADLNEQLIKQYGISINIGQTADVGDKADETNGAIGASIQYLGNQPTPWLRPITDGLSAGPTAQDDIVFNFLATNDDEPDVLLDPTRAFSTRLNGFVPYVLADYRSREDFYLSPAWSDAANGQLRTAFALSTIQSVNNVDIIFTSDTTKWSRCVVVEKSSRSYRNLAYLAEGDKRDFDLRADANVNRSDVNNDGLPDIDTRNPGMGMGWFPGYAIDVETGRRLNIFFGENSVYDGTEVPEAYVGKPAGADMMFNPSAQMKLPVNAQDEVFQYYAGGQHAIYVAKTTYDSCRTFRENFAGSSTRKLRALRDVAWAGLVMALPGTTYKPYNQGLVPADAIVKLRVDNPYQVATGTNAKRGYPTYQFSVTGKQAETLDKPGIDNALRQIRVTPNPYYGFSDYEQSQFTTTVKITNLPAKCNITIYSLDGKFIRQYRRDEVGDQPRGGNRAIPRKQIIPDLEWDLKNAKGIPVSSGVYLIHVSAEGLGTRTIKWFGINRQFDPSGL